MRRDWEGRRNGMRQTVLSCGSEGRMKANCLFFYPTHTLMPHRNACACGNTIIGIGSAVAAADWPVYFSTHPWPWLADSCHIRYATAISFVKAILSCWAAQTFDRAADASRLGDSASGTCNRICHSKKQCAAKQEQPSHHLVHEQPPLCWNCKKRHASCLDSIRKYCAYRNSG